MIVKNWTLKTLLLFPFCRAPMLHLSWKSSFSWYKNLILQWHLQLHVLR